MRTDERMNNRGNEYLEWLDTKPKTFLPFNEWMFTYHENETELGKTIKKED